MALGIGLVLMPLALPVFSPWIYQSFYWMGAIPLLAGAYVVDIAVLAILWRPAHGRWTAFRHDASQRLLARGC